jgi:hypothetical protein
MYGFDVNFSFDVEFAPATGQTAHLGSGIDLDGLGDRGRIVLVPEALFFGFEHTTEPFE